LIYEVEEVGLVIGSSPISCSDSMITNTARLLSSAKRTRSPLISVTGIANHVMIHIFVLLSITDLLCWESIDRALMRTLSLTLSLAWILSSIALS